VLSHEGTILLIEDEVEVRQLLVRALERLDYDLVEAENGELGLEAARRVAGSLSLVVTDINMPVMSGLEFAREFRPLLPRVPILFITGLDLRISTVEAARYGGELLVKPFGPDKFLKTVTRVLAAATNAERSLA
jgi:DNA-binding response OmpR family regulator